MRKEYDFSKAKLVVPPIDRRKTRITIRIDTKILNWFRQRVHEAGGGNYQTMINDALKTYIECYHAKNKELSSQVDQELPAIKSTGSAEDLTNWMREINQKLDFTNKSLESLREQKTWASDSDKDITPYGESELPLYQPNQPSRQYH